jgi:hypothetical protein
VTDPTSVARTISATLVNVAGGFLRNTVQASGETCMVCRTTVTHGFILCRACQGHSLAGKSMPVADHVGLLTYALEGGQSHYLMRGYKSNGLKFRSIGILSHG